jgi:tetratricopeptide (TPR) repeat protein
MRYRFVKHAAGALALIFVQGTGGCSCTAPDDPGKGVTTASALATIPDPSSAYAHELAQTEKQIEKLQKVVEGRKDDWLMRQHLASALLDKANLTGQVADYKHVEKVLEEIAAIGEVGFAPKLLAAKLDYSVHRLDQAAAAQEELVGRSILKREQLYSAVLLGGQIAFQRGQYEEALSTFKRLADEPGPARTELALYYSKTGNTAEAEKLLGEALEATRKDSPKQRAWIRLQLGIMATESGRYEEAIARLKAADAEFSGWWLVREHLAEVYALMGNDAEAIPLYEAVVAETQLAAIFGPLAGCYERQGRKADADALVARARTSWQKQLEELPESAMGHGLGFFLEHGDAKEALELAKKNYATRPNGEAAVLLARAYLKSNDPKSAVELLEQTLATPWRSADLHDAARQAYAAVGSTQLAEAQKSLCVAANPRYYEVAGASGAQASAM